MSVSQSAVLREFGGCSHLEFVRDKSVCFLSKIKTLPEAIKAWRCSHASRCFCFFLGFGNLQTQKIKNKLQPRAYIQQTVSQSTNRFLWCSSHIVLLQKFFTVPICVLGVSPFKINFCFMINLLHSLIVPPLVIWCPHIRLLNSPFRLSLIHSPSPCLNHC